MWQGSNALRLVFNFFAGMRWNTLTFIDGVYDTHVTYVSDFS